MVLGAFLVEDHPMFREGVRIALESAGDLEVRGEAGLGAEALELLRKPEPPIDVVLLDLRLPDVSGIEVARSLRSDPGARLSTPSILMLSMIEDDESVITAMRSGAQGYVSKQADRDQLVRAVRTVAEGGATFSPVIADRLCDFFSRVHDVSGRAAFPQLTDREREILELVARGRTNRRIARQLVLSEKTVRNHVSHIFAKLEVSDRASAVVRARNAGLGD